MLRMMECPVCGAANSEKRETCYSCQNSLRPTSSPVQAQKSSEQSSGSRKKCVDCTHSTVYAPRGVKMSFEQVWCTLHNKVTDCCTADAECFEEAFSWKSNAILG